MFTTTSSKSNTSKNSKLAPDTPVQYLKGVGPRLASLFANKEIYTIRDLLYFFPRTYDDRSRFQSVAELTEGESATLSLTIGSVKRIPIRRGFGKAKSILEVRATDSTGTIALKWFNVPKGLDSRFKVGSELVVTGKAKVFRSHFEMVHPEVSLGVGTDTEKEDYNTGRIVPIYVEIEGISTRILRKILWNALHACGHLLKDEIPKSYIKKHKLPSLTKAIQKVHFPEENDSLEALARFKTPALQRFIYDEFFKFEFAVLKQRLKLGKERASSLDPILANQALEDLKKALPFELTGDQKKALNDITSDLTEPHPMNRLIQGDVGSGKTAVCLLAAGSVLAEGGQVALMAPTEILAEQHFANTIRLFGDKIRAALLTGKTSQADRAVILSRLQAGEPLILIGTHALIEDPVQFKKCNLIIIDEQQRFGVEQRKKLISKGKRKVESAVELHPHILTLTATPIPRTLALTVYGDLTVTSIKELPPGRSPIQTKVLFGSERKTAYQKIREEISKGRQAYLIFPLVNKSEAEGFESLRAAVTEAERLQGNEFSDTKVGLLHGKLTPQEKAQVMADFKRGHTQILVSTTVVEVGVDVPNATIMVIEHAERFGLSQLHQLRGRVGRGSHASYCYLLSHFSTSEITEERLSVMEKTTDGFEIAEADLKIRGPGEFLGTRQSGSLPFKVADLVRDRAWLFAARDDVIDLLKVDPELNLTENLPLKTYLTAKKEKYSETLRTS